MKAPLYDPGVPSVGRRRRFSGVPEQILQDVHAYAQVGVSHIILDIRSADLDQSLERMAWFAQEVMAHTE